MQSYVDVSPVDRYEVTLAGWMVGNARVSGSSLAGHGMLSNALSIRNQ